MIAARGGVFKRSDLKRTPSERAGQKSDQDTRRGGLAARADLMPPEVATEIVSGSPVSKSLNASAKLRPSASSSAFVRVAGLRRDMAAARVSPVAEKPSPHRVTSRGNASPRLRVEFSEPWKIWAEMDRKEKWSSFLDAARKYYHR